MKKQACKIVISSLAVWSLLVSSVWACTCSHHEPKPETAVVSCPHHEGIQIAVAETVDGGGHSLSSDVVCICSAAASKFVAEAANIKLQKQIAAIALRPAVAAADLIAAVSLPAFDSARPSYLADPFYILAPKRGPPPSLKTT